MKKTSTLIICICFLATIGCQNSMKNDSSSSEILLEIDTNIIEVMQLPMPNSHKFSRDEAEKRKHEIYDMQLSSRYFEWKNPTSGGAVHINKQDEIEVYQFTNGMMYTGKIILENGDTASNHIFVPGDTSLVVKKEDLKYHVGGDGYGNAASVLITSEYDLKKSKSIGLVLEELFHGGIQLYYLKRK